MRLSYRNAREMDEFYEANRRAYISGTIAGSNPVNVAINTVSELTEQQERARVCEEQLYKTLGRRCERVFAREAVNGVQRREGKNT